MVRTKRAPRLSPRDRRRWPDDAMGHDVPPRWPAPAIGERRHPPWRRQAIGDNLEAIGVALARAHRIPIGRARLWRLVRAQRGARLAQVVDHGRDTPGAVSSVTNAGMPAASRPSRIVAAMLRSSPPNVQVSSSRVCALPTFQFGAVAGSTHLRMRPANIRANRLQRLGASGRDGR